MIKTYKFNYDFHEASATFEVDTEKFTEKEANELLNFFVWEWDKNNDPVDEALKKYAFTAIRVATKGDYNTNGVKDEFDDMEGYYPVDGSFGIKLIYAEGYQFDEDRLTRELKSVQE